MRTQAIWAGLMLGSLIGPQALQAKDKTTERLIQMEVGEQKTMSFKDTLRVSIGNPKVADVKPLGDDMFLLYAIGPGATNLVIFRKDRPELDFRIEVADTLARETVVLKYADGGALEQLLRPYLTKRGEIRYEHRTRALTLVDEKPVVVVMRKMIDRFDVKPRQIQFVLRLVQADQAASPAPIPDEIRPVVKQIQEVLRYNQFQVVDQAFLAIEANRESQLQVGGQHGYQVDLGTEMVEGKNDSVRLRFHLYRYEVLPELGKQGSRIKHTLVATTVELKDGETAVLGASKINGDGKALITVVSMKLK
jgi:type II secretory pathway component GspD/PulD (secretin)